MLQAQKASSKVAEDDPIPDDNNKKDKDNGKEDKKDIKQDPQELIPELQAQIASLKHANSRLGQQNELVTDALLRCQSKEPEEKEIKNKKELITLLESLQIKLNELRNNIEAN